MRVLVFANGTVSDYEALAELRRPDDVLICADGGTRHCLHLGWQPHAIVGDLDSADAARVDAWAAAGTDVEAYHPEKNQTDLELALERALREGAAEIILVGALGGRLDQAVANLLIPAQRNWRIPIRIVDGNQTAQVLRGGHTLTLHGPVGSTVSAIPLSDTVTGITYTGMKYPLTDHTLHMGSTRGISNEMLDTTATVRIATGLLMIVQIA
jgi:thiamine pyrophosphokinase